VVNKRFEKPDAVNDALFTSLQTQGDLAMRAYDAGGCAGLSSYKAGQDQHFQLVDADIKPVCEETALHDYSPLMVRYRRMIVSSVHLMHRFGQQLGDDYVWFVPVFSHSGKQFFFLLLRPRDPSHAWFDSDIADLAFPEFAVAILVCGLTTLILGVLVTRPISKLRMAARRLAEGKLETRVEWKHPRSKLFREDEIQYLIEDFNNMASRLDSLVAAHRELLRDVSHELRSPLARLSVALELANDVAPPHVAEFLDTIEREVGRLSALIGQLLTLSSLDTMTELDDRQQFTLNDVVEDLLPDARFEAQARSCFVSFATDRVCTIQGNSELIYRAIENIVRNAIRYTRSGTAVEIELTAIQQDDVPWAVLRVMDKGPGIPEDQLESIFRPFYRIDKARQRATGGFGVGLAIADRAVRLHGGRISASNRPAGGLVLTISIPCLSVAPIEEALPKPAVPDQSRMASR
jgi:two-component system sensor histidine kinase CpxA